MLTTVRSAGCGTGGLWKSMPSLQLCKLAITSIAHFSGQCFIGSPAWKARGERRQFGGHDSALSPRCLGAAVANPGILLRFAAVARTCTEPRISSKSPKGFLKLLEHGGSITSVWQTIRPNRRMRSERRIVNVGLTHVRLGVIRHLRGLRIPAARRRGVIQAVRGLGALVGCAD